MSLAVIILTGDTPDILFRCLLGIKGNVFVDYKIYLAYNGQSAELESQIYHFLESHFSADQFKIIKYNFYNFAILNNDIIKNHLDNDTEYLLFCNNDVIIDGNCVNEMVSLISVAKQRIGTIGCRLLYENGLIQHDGQCIILWKNSTFRGVSHLNIGVRPENVDYLDYRPVIGNTFALCLCRLDAFRAVGGLNEAYQVCLEDVELNLKFLQKGYKNVILPSKFHALHLESYSRERTPHKKTILPSDYLLLIHFFNAQFMNGQNLLLRTGDMPQGG
jgi:hypothetical protein